MQKKHGKKIFGKCTTKPSTLPTKITVNKTNILDAKKIPDKLNSFFTNIGTDLANKFQVYQSDLILMYLKLILAWNLNRCQ